MIDVSDIIYDPDFVTDYNRVQVTGAMTNGIWAQTEGDSEPMQGIILPAKLDELKFLPEGQRLLASIKLYSLVEINMADQESGRQADLIQYLGDWYKVAWSRYYSQCLLWMVVAQEYQRATT